MTEVSSMNIVKEENICRLCLKVAENGFELIDENIRQTFHVLRLRVNLDISKDPIVCNECKEVTIKCSDFKSIYIDAEEVIDLNYKYEPIDGNSLCRFCSDHLSGTNIASLNNLMNDVTFTEMLQSLTPDMNFDFIKNPVICTPCKRLLECYFKFVKNCWGVEEGIDKYCRDEGAPSSGRVELSRVVRFLSENIDFDYTQTTKIKQEDALEYINEPRLKYDGGLIKIKEELDITEHGVDLNETASETRSGFKAETETIENVFKCSTCTFKTKHKNYLKRHTLIHRYITETKMHKCSMCSYETKRKGDLNLHVVVHKDISEVKMHKCSMCSYNTRHKRCLRQHMIVHKDGKEEKIYKCSICVYETNRKMHLNTHMLIHKNITEVETYRCSMCIYETKYKHSLKRHVLIHKDAEVEKKLVASFQGF